MGDVSQIFICKCCGPFSFDVCSFNEQQTFGYWPEFQWYSEIEAANMRMLYGAYYSRAVAVPEPARHTKHDGYCEVCIVRKLNQYIRGRYAIFCAPLWYRFCFELKYNWRYRLSLPTRFQAKQWLKDLWKSILE